MSCKPGVTFLLFVTAVVTAFLVTVASTALAQDNTKIADPDANKSWTNESEVALMTTTGNSNTESYSGKEKTGYTFGVNTFTNTARYLQTRADGTETARNWDFGLRYDYAFSPTWGAYVGYLIEADPYSGYVQRNSTDLGATCTLEKSKEQTWTAEAGLRESDTYTILGQHEYTNLGRLYTQYTRIITESLSAQIWLEYLPDLNTAQGYLANGEVSVTDILSKVLSLKVSYLEKYQNTPPVAGALRADTVFTTSLVAKF